MRPQAPSPPSRDVQRKPKRAKRRGRTEWSGEFTSQHLANILEYSHDGIAILDARQVIRNWSTGAEEIFGYSAREIIGKHAQILVPPELLEAGELEYIKRTLRESGLLRNYQTTRLTKSGAKVDINLTVSAIYNASGDLAGRSAIFRDLTESRRIEQQMRQSQRLASVAQLVTGLAHEIGAPLNVIAGRAELMGLELPRGDPMRKELQLIIRQTERVAELIRSLLQFARGKGDKKMRRCSLNSIVRDVTKLIGRQMKLDGIEIVADLSPRLPLLMANRMQLQEVALNLALNAWQAMAGGGTLRFATHEIERHDGPWVELEVSDNGAGISQEDQDRIFSPFFSTKPSGKGTGLGMTVVLHIVNQHGGFIDLDSTPGEGSRFRVLFPVKSAK